MTSNKYVKVRRSLINYYGDFPLYFRTEDNNYVLYKPEKVVFEKDRLEGERHPMLYIQEEYRIKALKKIQEGFNQDLKKNLSAGKAEDIKSTLCSLVGETLEEPRSGALNALPETIDIMVSGVSHDPEILKTIASISFKDYTTVIHSVNVMALTMGFCFFHKYSSNAVKRLGLSALLHDVGKTQIPLEILTAERKLTANEFTIMKSHTTVGTQIIKENKEIDPSIRLGALEHHEKLDGSGYPKGISDISQDGQLLAIIDCYEALTNEDRPYRRAKTSFETLSLLKDDLLSGKFNKDYFEKFCTSLL